jgi:dihydroorotase/N-acyl-D-amino-acid deacylase
MTLLLANGNLVDGTGAASYRGDILIAGDRIAAVGPNLEACPERVLDCTGLTVAPGFIDAHSHSDLQVLENRPEKTKQGVTAEVVGNCGFSAFPCRDHGAEIREFANGIFCGDDAWQWDSAAAYLAEAASRATTASVHPLTGHGTLRIAFAGMRQNRLESDVVSAMAGCLDECLAAGSPGFSTGLMYAPGSSAPFEELVELCSVVGRRGAIYCTHMRDYSWTLVESLEEQIRLARAAGCKLQISHLQAVGRANWSKQEQALERIEKARQQGLDIEFDIYPYLAGSTVLTQLLPQSALEGGAAALLGRLTNAVERREIARATEDRLAQSWPDILISGLRTARNQPLVGMTIAEIAARRGTEPVETVLDLLIEEEADVKMISFNQCEENLRVLLTHPQCTVISDGFYVRGRPHPRLYGTFAELLGKCCRERQWMSVEEAVHKITGKPAQRFGLKDRGVLQTHAYADITVFDPATVGTRATYSDPQQSPDGIHLVLREGQELFGQVD